MAELKELTLDHSQKIEIKAPPEDVWANLIRRMSGENATPDNTPMPMVLEEWPGGRWFRDLGDSQGHLWGFVQVIKAPTLLEIHGPMFMSYAVAGHIQIRVTQVEDACELLLRHRAVGMIDEDHRRGLVGGWQSLLDSVKATSE